jgi:hypothetical protein
MGVPESCSFDAIQTNPHAVAAFAAGHGQQGIALANIIVKQRELANALRQERYGRHDTGMQTTKKPPLAGRHFYKEERKSLGDNPGGDYRLSCWCVALYINRFCGLNGEW